MSSHTQKYKNLKYIIQEENVEKLNEIDPLDLEKFFKNYDSKNKSKPDVDTSSPKPASLVQSQSDSFSGIVENIKTLVQSILDHDLVEETDKTPVENIAKILQESNHFSDFTFETTFLLKVPNALSLREKVYILCMYYLHNAQFS